MRKSHQRARMGFAGIGVLAVLGAGVPVASEYWEETKLLSVLDQGKTLTELDRYASASNPMQMAAAALAAKQSLRAIPGLLKLESLPEPPRVPTKGLMSVEVHWHTAALAEICEARPIASFRVLLACLRHEDPLVRAEAADQLHGAGPWLLDAVPQLESALADPDPAARTAAARALWYAGEGPESSDFDGHDWLDAHSAFTPSRAAEQLGLPVQHGSRRWTRPDAVGVEVVLPALVDARAGAHDGNRYCALLLIKFLGEDCLPILPQLTALLVGPGPRVREHAARAIGCLGTPATGAASAIVPLLSASQRDVRLAAWYALRSIWGTRQVLRRTRELTAAGG